VAGGICAEHALTRSVRDSAALLDAVSGPAPGDPYRAPPPQRPFRDEVGAHPGRLRIGICTDPRRGQPVDPGWAAAALRAGELLEQLGHHVEEASPGGLDDPEYGPALGVLFHAFTGWTIGYWIRRAGRAPANDDIEPQTWAYWESARGVTATDYLLAVQAMQRITRSVATWFSTYDVWLTPTLGNGAPALGELVGTAADPLRGSRNAGKYLMFDGELANVTGNPAMSIPFGVDEHRLPIGVHVLGRFGDEALLFRLAAQIEELQPWAHVQPDQARRGSSFASGTDRSA
jgi:amidase